MTKINLTNNEIKALEACLNSDTREGQLSDNFSNGGPAEFAAALGISMKATGGVITSLQKKGLGWLDDREDDMGFDIRTGKSVKAKMADHIFWLTEAGVNAIFDVIEARTKVEALRKDLEGVDPEEGGDLPPVGISADAVTDWT